MSNKREQKRNAENVIASRMNPETRGVYHRISIEQKVHLDSERKERCIVYQKHKSRLDPSGVRVF